MSGWIDEALAHPGTATMTARSWRTYRAFVWAIANGIDPKTMTTVFSWSSLAAAVAQADPQAGHSRASVDRYLRQLRAWGLLGIVATGRTAQYAPKGGGGGNERAVYVLCVTRHLEPVEGFETPPLEEACVAPRTRAGGDLAQGQAEAEPLRGHLSEAAQARPQDVLPAHRQLSAWSRAITPRRKDEMLAAAATLCHLIPAIGARLSPQHVRSILRPYFLAGWTLSDVQHAIDKRPNGTRWPHDGADGVGNTGAWLTSRLAAWKDAHGTVRRSESERVRAEQVELAARARARREAAAAARAATAGPLSPGRLAARVAAEAIRAGRTGLMAGTGRLR